MKRIRARRAKPGLAWASVRLALDAQQVIALRLAKLARGGPAAHREATKMVAEKVKAAADSQRVLLTAAVTGKSGDGPKRVINLLQRRVSANKRRLSKRS